MNFQLFKKQTMEKLSTALEENKVDSLVIPILDCINSIEGYVSTSSCAGRIIAMQLPTVGDKKNAIFHGKWHRIISLDELKDSLKKYSKDQFWFITQSPIFHIAAESMEIADTLVKIGISSGFKHSGFKAVKDRIIVELVSTERMDVPIGIDGSLIISDEYLSIIHKLGNELLKRGHEKLKRLDEKIQEL